MESSSLDLLNYGEKVHATAGLVWELAVSSERNYLRRTIAINACLRTKFECLVNSQLPDAHMC